MTTSNNFGTNKPDGYIKVGAGGICQPVSSVLEQAIDAIGLEIQQKYGDVGNMTRPEITNVCIKHILPLFEFDILDILEDVKQTIIKLKAENEKLKGSVTLYMSMLSHESLFRHLQEAQKLMLEADNKRIAAEAERDELRKTLEEINLKSSR